jgi:hypothetical protein
MNITAVVARASANVPVISAEATFFSDDWLAFMEIGVEHELVLSRKSLSAIFACVDFSAHYAANLSACAFLRAFTYLIASTMFAKV